MAISTRRAAAFRKKAERKSCKNVGLVLYFNMYNHMQGGSGLEGFVAWLRQLQFASLLDMLLLVAASILCITVHETCHGFMAWKLGDPTAKLAGRLTLNPLKHIDPMGLVLLAVAKFGWAKPVPINAAYFKKPRQGMALTALAGPVSNVLLAWLALLIRSVLIFVLYKLGNHAVLEHLITLMVYLAIISSGLAVFNLFPIPPLDGSKVLFAVLPPKHWLALMRYERYGMILMAVLLLTGLLDTPLDFLRGGLIRFLDLITHFPLYGLLKLFP